MDMEGDILEMNTSCRIAFGAYIGSLDFLSASGVTDLPSTTLTKRDVQER